MSLSYPILEYDPERQAIIEPGQQIERRDVPEHCVICFFKEVIDKVVQEQDAKIAVDNRWEDGPHPIYEITFAERRLAESRLAFYHPGIGGGFAAALLEEAIAFGCRKFIVCGGCGVLEKDIAVGHLIVVSAAVRDEGASYHYLPPGREVKAHRSGVAALEGVLKERGMPYRLGKTWTTDAPYRETRAKVRRRRDEGCIAADMEAASLMAVAEYREVVLGQVLYGGDDLSGEAWDHRGWQSRHAIRESLFWLAAEACLSL